MSCTPTSESWTDNLAGVADQEYVLTYAINGTAFSVTWTGTGDNMDWQIALNNDFQSRFSGSPSLLSILDSSGGVGYFSVTNLRVSASGIISGFDDTAADFVSSPLDLNLVDTPVPPEGSLDWMVVSGMSPVSLHTCGTSNVPGE